MLIKLPTPNAVYMKIMTRVMEIAYSNAENKVKLDFSQIKLVYIVINPLEN